MYCLSVFSAIKFFFFFINEELDYNNKFKIIQYYIEV